MRRRPAHPPPAWRAPDLAAMTPIPVLTTEELRAVESQAAQSSVVRTGIGVMPLG